MPDTSHKIVYELFAVNPDGTATPLQKKKRNLILDVGLDAINSSKFADCTAYGFLGTGTNPTSRNSGATTFSQTGTTITASSGFFVADDTGRLLVLSDGTQVYLTYVSGTIATASTSGSYSGLTGTIYYVNDTGLQTQVKSTSSYRTSPGDNSGTYDSPTTSIILKRSLLFSAETGPQTYTEIGWGWQASGNQFGRDVFSSPISLIAGQQVLAVVSHHIKISPVVPTAVTDVSGGTFDTSGTAMIESYNLGSVFATIGSNGHSTWSFGPTLEPAATCSANAMLAPYSQLSSPSDTVTGVPYYGSSTAVPLTKSGYTSGNFYVDRSATFGVSSSNGTIYGIAITTSTGTTLYAYFDIKLTTPKVKDNTHSLAATFRQSWQRDFS